MDREIKTEATLPLPKRILFYLLLIATPYLVLETIFTPLYVNGIIFAPDSAWLLEDSGKTIHFDPVRGFKLSPVPSRFARITNGEIEYVGAFRGNSLGFPDRDDFGPQRKSPDSLRLAVFGDSFTAAQYIEQNWPDKLEDMSVLNNESRELELLNFSVSGGGLANWWSVLTHIVKKDTYDIDGIVFAVFPGDLSRGFTISEHRGYDRYMLARMRSTAPENWPQTVEEARKLLVPLNGHIVTKDQFSKALNHDWHPDIPRPWKPYFAIKTYENIRAYGKLFYVYFINPRNIKKSKKNRVKEFSEGQLVMINDVKTFAQKNSLPVWVVYIPSKGRLVNDNDAPEEILKFSRILDARYIDGGKAFFGLTEEQISEHYFPYDPHWNQKGSDRFASFFFDLLNSSAADWLGQETAPGE